MFHAPKKPSSVLVLLMVCLFLKVSNYNFLDAGLLGTNHHTQLKITFIGI